MKKITTMLNTDPDCMIRLTHHADDVCSWILETWRKGFPFRRDHVTRWYNTRAQAEQAARDIVRRRTATAGA